MSYMNQVQYVRTGIENLKKLATSEDTPPHVIYAEVKRVQLDKLLKEAIDALRDAGIEFLRNHRLEGKENQYTEDGIVYEVRGGGTRIDVKKVAEYMEALEELERTDQFRSLSKIKQKYTEAAKANIQGKHLVEKETGEVLDLSRIKITYTPDVLITKKAK